MSEWKDELNNESDDLKDLEPVTDSKPPATEETNETNETSEDPTEVDKVDTLEMLFFECALTRMLWVQELEAMKQRVKDMEAEAAKLRDMQAEVEQQLAPEEGMTFSV